MIKIEKLQTKLQIPGQGHPTFVKKICIMQALFLNKSFNKKIYAGIYTHLDFNSGNIITGQTNPRDWRGVLF